ncbi:uncharacterized protein LOC129984565 [Argiope bruennichi]|uniref:uncharacterized protein LOC129984565 n=1 Tax=Argiope bruennichi TaxID=94029 RepID=UPI0024941F8D|nr:uncharacterized protein LOC129984565 [Argiope bruennichi]
MENREIDSDKLIQEVHKYRSLWDQTSLDYLNSSLKIKEWALVALEMDCSVEEVKSQWKALKDTFIREMRRTAKSGQGSKWNYFDSMSFLFQGLNTLLLPSAISQSLTEFDSPYASSISCENEFSENSSVAYPEEDPKSSQRKKVKFNQENTDGILHSTPYQSVSPIQFNGPRPEDFNEDYYFLLSLLPSFKRMPDQQKMILKIKIMQEVCNAAHGESVSNLSPNSSSGIGTCSSEFLVDT